MNGSGIVLCLKSLFMAQILGLGGVFIRAKDPKTLAAWYENVLGVKFEGKVYVSWNFMEDGKVTPGYNVLSFFAEGTDYFDPSTKQAMLNLRVDNLKELLAELKEKDVTMVGEMMDEEYGKFGWILDPEGNKIELWETPSK